MSYFSKLRSQSNDGIAARLHRSVGGQSTAADPGGTGVGTGMVGGELGPEPDSPQGLAFGIEAMAAGMLGNEPSATFGPDPAPDNGLGVGMEGVDPGPSDSSSSDSSSSDSGGGDSSMRRGGRARR